MPRGQFSVDDVEAILPVLPSRPLRLGEIGIPTRLPSRALPRGESFEAPALAPRPLPDPFLEPLPSRPLMAGREQLTPTPGPAPLPSRPLMAGDIQITPSLREIRPTALMTVEPRRMGQFGLEDLDRPPVRPPRRGAGQFSLDDVEQVIRVPRPPPVKRVPLTLRERLLPPVPIEGRPLMVGDQQLTPTPTVPRATVASRAAAEAHRRMTPGAGPMPPMEEFARVPLIGAGAAQVVAGVRGLAREVPANLRRAATGQALAPSAATKAAMSDVLEGVFGLLPPALGVGAVTAPLATLTSLVGAYGASRGAEILSEQVGADAETSRLIGNVAAIVGGATVPGFVRTELQGLAARGRAARVARERARVIPPEPSDIEARPVRPVVGRLPTEGEIGRPVQPPPEAPPVVQPTRPSPPRGPAGPPAVPVVPSGATIEPGARSTSIVPPVSVLPAPMAPPEPLTIPQRAQALRAEGYGEQTPAVRALLERRETPGVSPTGAERRVAGERREYSSTQVNLPEDLAQRVRALGETIPDAYLMKDGREGEPHVTVKYGLQTKDPAAVRELLAGESPIIVTLGKTAIFSAKEAGGGADVVMVEATSPDLDRLNKKISEALPNADTKPYKPHVTVAYVKPGLGQRYAGDASLEGETVTIDRVMFSSKAGGRSVVPLTGLAKGAPSAIEARVEPSGDLGERPGDGGVRPPAGPSVGGGIRERPPTPEGREAPAAPEAEAPVPPPRRGGRVGAEAPIAHPPTEGLPDYAKQAVYNASMERRTNEGGSIDAPDPFAGGRWVEQSVPLSTITANPRNTGLGTPAFKGYRGSVSKGPIVIDDRGEVIDGSNRVHEAIGRGDSSISAYVFQPPAPIPAPEAGPAAPSPRRGGGALKPPDVIAPAGFQTEEVAARREAEAQAFLREYTPENFAATTARALAANDPHDGRLLPTYEEIRDGYAEYLRKTPAEDRIQTRQDFALTLLDRAAPSPATLTRPAKAPAEVVPAESGEVALAQRVFDRLRQTSGPIEQHPVKLRARLAAALGIAPQRLADQSDAMNDAIEAVINQRVAPLAPGVTLDTLIVQGQELEATLPRAARSLEKTKLQQFSTPLPIAAAATVAAGPVPGDLVLEPTAGTGNLVAALPEGVQVQTVELSPRRAALLRAQGYQVTEADYLRHTPDEAPTVIITNPPWGKYSKKLYGPPIAAQFIPVDVAERFVAKNMRDLAEGGRLIAVMPTTIVNSSSFKAWLTTNFTVRAIIKSPPGAYTTRATDVESLLLVVDKAAPPAGQRFPTVIDTADWSAYSEAVQQIPARQEVAHVPAPAPAPGRRPAEAPGAPAERPAGGVRERPRPTPTEAGETKLDTPEAVTDALEQGILVTLRQQNPDTEKPWQLKLRQDQRIAVVGARMADRSLLLNNGATYAQVGNYWYVKDGKLAQFLERFPVAEAAPVQAQRETPRGGGGGGGAPASVGRFAGVAPRVPAGAAVVRPLPAPELVELARTLQATPSVIKKFRKPGKLGEFRGRGGIRLSAELFKKGEERQLAAALAHELGHLVDWLPHQTLKRGNLLGRLFSLRSFLRHTFTTADGTIIKNAEIRAELRSLSAAWRPWERKGARASFIAYRESARELYADALSVLLNDPARLEREAPIFYREFFEALDAKPDVKSAYFELQTWLSGEPEALIGHRRAGVRGMFTEGDTRAMDLERLRQQERRLTAADLWLRTRIQLVDKNVPLIDRVKALERRGVRINPDDDPRYLLEERNYLGGKLKAFTARHFQPLYQHLTEGGIDWHTFGEALFYDRIIAGDRSELANPRGIAPDVARELRADLVRGLDAEQQRELEDAATEFRAVVKDVAERAYEAGLYTDALHEQMQKNPAYVTFRVIDHIEDRVTSRVYQQIGTLKDVTNPADATILKVLVTLRAIEHNRIKTTAFDFLEQHYPQDVERAKEVWTGKGLTPVEPKDPKRQRLVTFYRRGRLRGLYVDPYIADSLENASVGQNFALVSALRWVNTGLFRPVFTSLNLGFQTFNVFRDFFRFWKNVPGMTLGRATRRYAQAIPMARARAFGVPESASASQRAAVEELLQAEEAGALSVTFNDLNAGRQVEETQIEEILAQQGLGRFKPTPGSRWLAPVRAVFRWIADVGNFIETLPKAAGLYEFRGKGTIADIPADQRSVLRRKVGSPDFLAGGTWKPVTNEILLFSNAFVQAVRSDLEVAREPKTSSGFWWKTIKLNIMPKLLAFAAITGLAAWLAGKDEEEDDPVTARLRAIHRAYRGTTEYDLTNYTVVPLGTDARGQSVYVRIPQDDFGRTIGGLAWKIMNGAAGRRDVMAAAMQVADYTAGQFPSVSPALEIPSDIAQFVAGRNVYDPFRSRFLFTEDEVKARDVTTLKKFLGYEFQQLGGGILWRFSAGDPRPRVQTTGQKILDFPVVSNLLGRWIKVTQFGQTERLREAERAVGQTEARARQTERRAVNEALRSYQALPPAGQTPATLRRVAREMATTLYATETPPVRARRQEAIFRKLRMGSLRGESDALTDAVLSAGSNAQRVAALVEASASMSQKEFTTWMMRARQEGVISPNVWQLYAATGRRPAARTAP